MAMNRRNDGNQREEPAAAVGCTENRRDPGGQYGDRGREFAGWYGDYGGKQRKLLEAIRRGGNFLRGIHELFGGLGGPDGRHWKRGVTIQAASADEMSAIGEDRFALAKRDFFLGPIDLVAPTVRNVPGKI